MGHRQQQGLTLIELMVTLAIAAIILAIGVPAMNGMVARNQVTAELNQLNSLLRQARYAALEQRMPVVVCPTKDFENCDTTDWDLPKMAFIQRQGDTTSIDAGDQLVATLPQTSNVLTLKSKPTDTSVSIWTFQPAPRNSTEGQFVICPSDTSMASGLEVNSLGRIKLSESTPSCA